MKASSAARTQSRSPRGPEKAASTQSEIIAAIEQDIVSGRILGNRRLDERELAVRFGVSRTPIREVLNRLVTSGLVEYRPNQGMFTAAMSLSQFTQMYEVMCHLEGLCAQLCARRMSAKDKSELARMQELGGKAAASGDATEYSRHNLAFHDTLYRGCQNEILQNQVRALRRRLEPYRNYSFHLPNRIQESHAEHGQIVKLILDGDSQAAEMSMRSHMDIQRSNFSDYLIMLAKALSND